MARITNINYAELEKLDDDPEIVAGLKRAAEAVARNARRRAPKDTGAGARSIHVERTSYGFRVLWDSEHDYMQYAELGTRTRPARPFMRPAVTDVKGGR